MCPGINRLTFLARSTGPGRPGSHTSQNARCMRHPRLVLAAQTHPTVGSQAGMCPGINLFTYCAPIADGVGTALFPCSTRFGSRNGRAVKALPYGAAGETQKPKFAKRTWNVPWNQQIDFFGAVHGPG